MDVTELLLLRNLWEVPAGGMANAKRVAAQVRDMMVWDSAHEKADMESVDIPASTPHFEVATPCEPPSENAASRRCLASPPSFDGDSMLGPHSPERAPLRAGVEQHGNSASCGFEGKGLWYDALRGLQRPASLDSPGDSRANSPRPLSRTGILGRYSPEPWMHGSGTKPPQNPVNNTPYEASRLGATQNVTTPLCWPCDATSAGTCGRHAADEAASLRVDVDSLLRTNLNLQAQLCALGAHLMDASAADSEGNTASEDSTASDLAREEHALAEQLRRDEAACADVGRRASEAEARLATCREELDALRQRSAPNVDYTRGSDEDQDALRQQLDVIQAARIRRSQELQLREEQHLRMSHALDCLRVEYNETASEHGVLRSTMTKALEQLHDEHEALVHARRALESGPDRQDDAVQLQEVEAHRWEKRALQLEEALDVIRARLKLAVDTANSARSELLQRQGFLSSLRCAGSDCQAKLKGSSAERQLIAELRERGVNLQDERDSTLKRIEKAQSEQSCVQAEALRRMRQVQQTSEMMQQQLRWAALADERLRGELLELRRRFEGSPL